MKPRQVYRSYPPFRQPQTKRPTGVVALLAVVVLVALGGAGFFAWKHLPKHAAAVASPHTAATADKTSPAEQPAPKPNKCAGNTLSQMVLVSISERHMWACAAAEQQYDAPVITGMQNLPADLTPTGTYKVYGKQTELYLKGSDSTGSWNDFVHYWMPFLSNQYGIYGFHDATWRADSAFGNVDPYSKDASHGCVELPLAAAKWLYNWAPVGTTVTIVS